MQDAFLSWKHYLAYLVTEELVGSNTPNGYADEVYTGKILRVCTKSHFLDHVIDVVSYHPPEVKVLASGEGLSNQETWLQ